MAEPVVCVCNALRDVAVAVAIRPPMPFLSESRTSLSGLAPGTHPPQQTAALHCTHQLVSLLPLQTGRVLHCLRSCCPLWTGEGPRECRGRCAAAASCSRSVFPAKVDGKLTRKATRSSPKKVRAAMRAWSLPPAGTASSRSMQTASAPDASAEAKRSGRVPGTKSKLCMRATSAAP